MTLSVKAHGDRVRIAVRDTGPSISDEVMQRVANYEMSGNKIGLLNVHHRVKKLRDLACQVPVSRSKVKRFRELMRL